MTILRGHALSRRDWLSFSAGLLLGPKLQAAIPGKSYYRDYSKCLPNHLSALARVAYEKRTRELSTLRTPAAIQQRQQWARETFWKLVGGEPQRTPLNVKITGHLDRPGYRVEKLIYESRPGVVVSANLYIPASGEAPFPGVLFQMGHASNGKSYAPYQKCCQGLARLGYVVLAFDPMGQGERIAYPDASGKNTRLSSVDDEHSVPGKQMLLLGDSATRFQVWDAIRGLDYLASHPAVDKQRLASTGQSGGATLAMLLACVDSRLSAAAISSGNTEDFAVARFNAPGSTDDAEQDFIGSGSVSFDRWDLLYPLAPKPLLIQVSEHDFFGTYSPRYLDDGLDEFTKLSAVYETLGHPERLSWRSGPLTHSLNYELRLGIYNWFERWLKHSERAIEKEPPVAPEEDSILWTGPTGNVTRDFGSMRPFDLIKRRASGVDRTNDAKAWVQTLNIQAPARTLRVKTLAETVLSGVHVRATEVQSAPEVWIPAWWFMPDKPDPSKAPLLVLDDRGRNTHAHEDDLYHRLSQAGRCVYAADVRGIGDSRPEVGRGNPAYTIPHNSEEEFAWASLILGDCLLAQRISDILAIVQAFANESRPASKICIAARGRLTVPALFAFSLADGATSLYLSEGLASYRSVLETEDYQQPLANFAWRLFEMTDLPLVASSCATRRIHLAGTRNAADQTMPVETVRAIYTDRHIRISAEPAWDEAALGAIS